MNCKNCTHVQVCTVWGEFKRAWDRTYHHLTPSVRSLAELSETVGENCIHFEPATIPQKTLAINPGRGLR